MTENETIDEAGQDDAPTGPQGIVGEDGEVQSIPSEVSEAPEPQTTVPTPEDDARMAWEEDIKEMTRENGFIFNEAINASLAYVGRLMETEGHPFSLSEDDKADYDTLDEKGQTFIRRRFFRQVALTQSPFALEMAKSVFDGVKKDLMDDASIEEEPDVGEPEEPEETNPSSSDSAFPGGDPDKDPPAG